MKRALCILLAVLLIATAAMTLTACEEKQEGPVTSISEYKAKGEWQTINKPLTWEAINSFPVVNDDMTIEEGRQLVVDFFRFSKTALWTPSETCEYAPGYFIDGGTIFGGLPYISEATGSIYRLMDYMDEETHVVNMEKAGLKSQFFGNQCSFGSYIGYGRVINSAQYSWTWKMTQAAGFVLLGGYTYEPTLTEFREKGYSTPEILAANGQDFMNECYALLKHGDGIVNYTTAGHVIMISGDAHVEYGADGKIDAGKSYVTVIDQTGRRGQATNEMGDTYKYEMNVDLKMTFLKLFQDHYIPFTFKEWTGEDPIEKSVTTFSHTGDTITYEQLCTAYAESNYGIGDLYASFYDKHGNEVFKMARRCTETSMKKLDFRKLGIEMDYWGSFEDLDPKKDYTVKVYAQISTGERPVLWEGKLAK